MRKSLILATSLGTLIISSAAFAASMGATGPIKSIDANTNSVTLTDGKQCVLPVGFDIKTLKTGEKVSITYELKDKKTMASTAKPG
jgi:Cu/Ag efflux protein CusF